MRTIKNILGGLRTPITGLLIGAFLTVTLSVADAVTQYPAGALLQPGDVTTAHIRDATIAPADINTTQTFNFGSLKSYDGMTAASYVSTTTATNGYQAGVGTVSLPAYSFVGDTNTGIYSSVADQVNISVGGVTAMSLLSGQINTNSAWQFRVGTGASASPMYSYNGDTDTGINASTANTLNLITAGVIGATISPTSNFGIGTTSPYTKLAVGGTVTATGFTATSTGYTFPDNTVMTTAAVPQYNATSTIAGEALTAGDAISIGDGATGSVAAETGSNYPLTPSATVWVAGATTTPSVISKITDIQFRVRSDGASPNQYFNLAIEIRNDSAGTPGSTVLYSGTQVCPIANYTETITCPHTLSTPLSVNPSTKYWFVYSNPTSQSQLRDVETADTTNKIYSSINSGSTWSIGSFNPANGYGYTINNAGEAYKASAATTNYRFNQYVGFAATTVATSTSVNIYNFGWLKLFSGLTQGSTYYLSDTQGAIGTSAGSQSLIVGRAINTQTLMTRNP